ncbi:hypothetical protein ACFLU8_01550 [Chloroflexota bacterium]
MDMFIPDLPDEKMKRFIEEVYREPYSLTRNNCIQKSVKITKKAQELGKAAPIMLAGFGEK